MTKNIFTSFKIYMKTQLYNTQTSFRGYDAIPLKAIYMQGLTSAGERKIFHEMSRILKTEGVDLFVNENNKSISKTLINAAPENKLSIWAQDTKAFIENRFGKMLLWNSKESLFKDLNELKSWKVFARKYMPRGGNYYLGYGNNKEKWLLINSMSIYNKNSFDYFGDNPTLEHLRKLFNVKPKNIHILDEFYSDIDEVVRPIGYPNILVNNYSESAKNIEKMREKFPESKAIYETLKKHIETRTQDNHCEKLKEFGFNPIPIVGRYTPEINFINAIAFENKNGKISYITNSTKNSLPELEYLETLFEQDLRKKVPNIENIHFISGGKLINEKIPQQDNDIFHINLPDHSSFKERNVIMDILANRFGGIHCMSAEIPNL